MCMQESYAHVVYADVSPLKIANLLTLTEILPVDIPVEIPAELPAMVISIVAHAPLIRAFALYAKARQGHIRTLVVIAEKEALVCCANVCCITFDLDGIVALTVPLNPTNSGRFGYAPGWVILRASVVEWG